MVACCFVGHIAAVITITVLIDIYILVFENLLLRGRYLYFVSYNPILITSYFSLDLL